MSLFFSRHEIANRARGLTFDDVLITPLKSTVRSRRDPSLKSQIVRGLEIDVPVMSANMDTITESAMATAMHREGAIGCIHRFMSIEDQVRDVNIVLASGAQIVAASIGVGDDAQARAKALVDAGCHILTIDIAHGHSEAMIEMTTWLKDRFPSIKVISGNIAMPHAAEDLIRAGADAIKVGIGPGSMCTTRIITGCGVPQLTAIALCSEVADAYGVPVIADGGLRTSGDIVKAFAAGASSVMLGSMLAGTMETPGEIKSGRKAYRGMASKAAQISWRGGLPEGMAAEGEATSVAIKGHVREVLLEVTGGIRSGMSYINATTIGELRAQAMFIEISQSGTTESRAHGLFN